MPAAYVAEHVRLGYASTVHSAQGLTADTCHTVLTGTESRQLLYVAMSRGRDANYVHLAAAADGDPHTVVDPETLAPSTAIEILARMLHRDEGQRSATTAQRSLIDPAPRLHEAVLRYQDALEYAAIRTLGAAWRTSLDEFAEHLVPGVIGCAAYPTLLSRLALEALSGRYVQGELLRAFDEGELGSAHDAAAVLDHRLGTRLRSRQPIGGPLPWLAGIPRALAASKWGDYLDQRARLVADLTDEVRACGNDPSSTSSAGLDTPLGGDLAVWRAAYGVPASDPPPNGPAVHGLGAAFQRSLDSQMSGRSRTGRNWTGTLPAAVLSDPRRGLLYQRLDDLASSGADVRTMVDQALARGPLPTEAPADALQWRLARLTPTVPPPEVTPRRAALRPPAPTRGQHHDRMGIPGPARPSHGVSPSR